MIAVPLQSLKKVSTSWVAWKSLTRRALRALFYGNKRIPFMGKHKHLSAPERYLDECHAFAENAKNIFFDSNLDLIINSDNITLAAGALVAKTTGAKRIYDAIELPHLDSRAGDAFERYSHEDISRIHKTEEAFINSSDAITTIGPSARLWLSEKYSVKNIQVVRNCRNFQKPSGSNIKKDIGLKDEDILVLFINSIYPNQGIEEMLQALSHLPAHIHFAALGPLPRPKYLNTIAKLANAQKRFHVLPPKSWEEMLSYASGADIGILPRQPNRLNNILSLPNRIFELIMARLPIASTNLPDIAAIVGEYRVGEVFDPTQPRDIADVILKMIKNLPMYKKNLDLASRELCWEEEQKKFLGTVESLFENGKKLKVLILTRKDISDNNRIARLSKTLTESGHDITIAAPYPPGNVQRDPRAKYVLCNCMKRRDA